MSEILNKIKTRGYWQVIIKPTEFIADRIKDISVLFPILQKHYVYIRGWDYPHLEDKNSLHIDTDWVSQDSEWMHNKSSWRFYQSGLFVHLHGMSFDWRDESDVWPGDADWCPSQYIGIGNTIFTFTEIYELASRLSMSEAGAEHMDVEITIFGLNNRKLYLDSSNRHPLDNIYEAHLDTLPIINKISRQELVAKTKEYAIESSIEFFRRFGWNPTFEIIKNWQDEHKK